MRESNTVGWSAERGELQFIAEDPGPVLLVTPDLLRGAFQQRDGSWLLRGYTDPDYTQWCEFLIRTPLYQLALSLTPAATAAAPAPHEPLEGVSEPREAVVGGPPAPPRPATGSKQPVSFYRPRPEPTEQRQTVAETDLSPMPKVELSESADFRQAQSYRTEQSWVVRFVWNDPTVRDESEETLEVTADSDAGALRALHAEMSKRAEEPSYRVVAVVPADQAEVAA